MSKSILSKDLELKFPHFVVLKASAGSGKTYALTLRFVQFLLSEKIPKNKLRNILAITFSNNASKEMRERIINCLKDLYFENPFVMDIFTKLVSLNKETISKVAGAVIEEILGNYADFNVKTIDSFMTSIFKASAIDFGYNPDFEIVMDNDAFMDYSFNIFLRKVFDNSPEAHVLTDIIKILGEQRKEGSSFLWDPVPILLDQAKRLYLKIASLGKEVEIIDYSQIIKQKAKEIKKALEDIDNKIAISGLEKNRNSTFYKLLDLVKKESFTDIISLGLSKPPVNKPSLKERLEKYNELCSLWQNAARLIKDYISIYSNSYYIPYLKVYNEFTEIIENTKRNQGKIFIGDINHYLASYIKSEIVPDVYFRIGETIYHFLIDEFQDTSPIQWNNILPLISNSLSQGGSLFVVGDTKQAIYGFRDADYKIMKDLENKNPFPSAQHIVQELTVNYRSLPQILKFNERIFKENDKYQKSAQRSGLSDFTQVTQKDLGTGYVDVLTVEKDIELQPEKQTLIEIIYDIKNRGYNYGDIAILALRNDDVINITKLLSEQNIDFISMSSLDVRHRKITLEIISLINFLDSPLDDLSFTAFIMGNIFAENLRLKGRKDFINKIQNFLILSRDKRPLYKSFQKEFVNLWEEYFEELFRLIGYLPLYEIVDRIIKTFNLFEIKPDEEAALIKILEAVKEFESSGQNSIKDFLSLAKAESDDSSKWNIALPSNIDAVRVMTIHKAKGLGFPIVIVLLYEIKNKGFEYIVDNSNQKIRLLKINADMAKNNEVLGDIYNEERINDMVDKLNTLYVGFTRAERELYVIGVKGRINNFPFDIIKPTDYPMGNKTKKILDAKKIPIKELILFHHNETISYSTNIPRLINLGEKRRGEFIHKILSFITYVEEGFREKLIGIIDLVSKDMRLSYPIDEIIETIIKVTNHDQLKEFFCYKPDRIIKNEMEVVNTAGNLHRIDRIVIDDKKITLIDYKTGLDFSAKDEHLSQIKNYINIIKGIYPDKKIEGIIAYIDLNVIHTVQIR